MVAVADICVSHQVHIVNFEDGLIKQIRLYWDQSCLLKQIGVIGRNGRNWPIKDGRDQCKLVGTSVLGATSSPGAARAAHVNGNDSSNGNSNGNSHGNGNSNGYSNGNGVRAAGRSSSTSSNNNPTRDPHRSLSLFSPQEEDFERVRGPVVAPRGSAKPPPRNLGEILGADDDGKPLAVGPTETFIAPKGCNGFPAQRTFEIGSNEKTPMKKDRTVIMDPKKFQHFEFSDFTTPEKKTVVNRRDDERHFGWSDDEELPEPIRLPKKLVPRKDAETHFSFKNEDTPETRTIQPSRRGVDSHFEIADSSPVANRVRKETSMNRKATNNNMASHWGENESPGGGFFDSFGKEQTQGGIAIAGDGIGTRKAQGREWDFDEEIPDQRKQNVTLPSRTARSQTQSSAGSNYWDQNY